MTRALTGVVLLVCTGCAQIDSHSTVEVRQRPDLEPRWLGEAKTVVGRDLAARWSQSLSTIEVTVEEARRCRAVLHEPVDRVETVDNTVKHGALYWEYGVGAALLAVGLAALIEPEAFSNRAVDSSGNTARDTTTGYRLGGIFTALGAGIVGIGAYDTVRSRDSVSTTRAYRITTGESTPCISPSGPKAGVEVQLTIGPWSDTAKTDDRGRVRFGLPDESTLGIEIPQPPPAPPPEAPAEGQPTEPEPESESEPIAPAPATPAQPPEVQTVEVTAVVRAGTRRGEFTVIAPLASAEARSGTIDLLPEGTPRPSAP